MIFRFWKNVKYHAECYSQKRTLSNSNLAKKPLSTKADRNKAVLAFLFLRLSFPPTEGRTTYLWTAEQQYKALKSHPSTTVGTKRTLCMVCSAKAFCLNHLNGLRSIHSTTDNLIETVHIKGYKVDYKRIILK